jgi:hypothetical protein
MQIIRISILFLFTLSAHSSPANFYANPELQLKYPNAFATQLSAIPFHKYLEESVQSERYELIQAITEDFQLHHDILAFETLSLENQVKVLERLFQIECDVLSIVPPTLIIDETSIPGYAFFEFDYLEGGSGKVFINKKKLKEEKNKSEFIILLLHETRHSAQFQLSQTQTQDIISKGYEASFKTQKELKTLQVKISFCDFMLLINEFEAFQFANYIYGSLTNWQDPITSMGTLGSQYSNSGELRLNLLEILNQTNIDPVVLFNQLEIAQYKVMYH